MNRSQLRQFVIQVAGRIMKWSTVEGLTTRFGWLRATMPPIEPTERSTTQNCRNMNVPVAVITAGTTTPPRLL